MTDLSSTSWSRERSGHWLSPEEITRAEQLLSSRIRETFSAGRAFLRHALALQLDRKPENISLETGIHGKPFLADSRLRFNLSHSRNLALLATSSGCDVGVDLEYIRDDLDYMPIARRFFSTREQAELSGLPEPDRRLAFYRCWTRKEAYLKGHGSGFYQSAAIFDVSLLPGQPPALLLHRGDSRERDRWLLADIDVFAGFCATLAYAGPSRARDSVQFIP